MTTFVDQVRELGIKQAVIAKTDEVVERITAGMNVNDVRAALRGDEPRRPNPRLRPHADGFWLHIRPSFYHTEVTNIYPTFRMGWMSTFMFVWETITGIILMVFYTPSPLIAYGNMWNILSNVPLGQLFRNMHRLGAEVMVIVVALHMLRTFVTGSYKKPRQFTWATGMILLVLTLMLSFSGYLLPWDQLAYWALTVFLSAAEAAPAPPVVNQNILLIAQGGHPLALTVSCVGTCCMCSLCLCYLASSSLSITTKLFFMVCHSHRDVNRSGKILPNVYPVMSVPTSFPIF